MDLNKKIEKMEVTILQAAPQGGMGMMNIVMIALMFGVFYLFFIRPQNKKRKAAEAFRKNIQKGDKVVSIGGIHGKVAEVKDTTVIITTEGGGKLEMEKSAVSMDASSIMTEEVAKQST